LKRDKGKAILITPDRNQNWENSLKDIATDTPLTYEVKHDTFYPGLNCNTSGIGLPATFKRIKVWNLNGNQVTDNNIFMAKLTIPLTYKEACTVHYRC